MYDGLLNSLTLYQALFHHSTSLTLTSLDRNSSYCISRHIGRRAFECESR